MLLIKPKPNKKFFDLPAKEATMVAARLAKDYSLDGSMDMSVFKDFAVAHGKRQRDKQQLAFFSR